MGRASRAEPDQPKLSARLARVGRVAILAPLQLELREGIEGEGSVVTSASRSRWSTVDAEKGGGWLLMAVVIVVVVVVVAVGRRWIQACRAAYEE